MNYIMGYNIMYINNLTIKNGFKGKFTVCNITAKNSGKVFVKELKSSKNDSLKMILDRGTKKSPTVWFVEDRLNTLTKIVTQPELEAVKLYFADWGYNTLLERQAALLQPRIQTIALTDLAALGGEMRKTSTKAKATVEKDPTATNVA